MVIYLIIIVPSLPPTLIGAHNISSTGLNVEFTTFPDYPWQGIPLGYYIYYRQADDPNECEVGEICNRMIYSVCYGPAIDNCDIGNLELNTNYSVCVAGYTNAGAGPISECVFVETDTYGAYFFYNYFYGNNLKQILNESL